MNAPAAKQSRLARDDEVGKIQLQMLNYEDQRAELVDLEDEVEAVMSGLDANVPKTEFLHHEHNRSRIDSKVSIYTFCRGIQHMVWVDIVGSVVHEDVDLTESLFCGVKQTRYLPCLDQVQLHCLDLSAAFADL